MSSGLKIPSYVGAALGFVAGFLIGQWFCKGAPPSDVLTTLQTICAFTGAIGGFATGTAFAAGNGRAKIVGAISIAACLLVGVAIMVYRWLFL